MNDKTINKPGEQAIRAACFQDFASGNYEPPTAPEVREMFRRLEISGGQAAELCGTSGRNVRRWQTESAPNKENATTIPYSCWWILCLALFSKQKKKKFPDMAEALISGNVK